MFKLKLWSKSFFVKPEKEIFAIEKDIEQLRKVLHALYNSKFPLIDIVRFFSTGSKWQDGGGVRKIIDAFANVNYGQHDRIIKKLQMLQNFFTLAGRNEYGLNRTKKGEAVTEDKIFLGNVYGLSTHNIPFWKERKDEKKGGWGYTGMEDLNAFDVVSKQAKSFMDDSIKPVFNIVVELEKIAKSGRK